MLTCFLSLGLAAPPTVRIVHSGLACNIEEERYSERVYTIREGETLELTCLVTGHPRPQVSPRHRSLPVPEPASPAAWCQARPGCGLGVGELQKKHQQLKKVTAFFSFINIWECAKNPAN